MARKKLGEFFDEKGVSTSHNTGGEPRISINPGDDGDIAPDEMLSEAHRKLVDLAGGEGGEDTGLIGDFLKYLVEISSNPETQILTTDLKEENLCP